MGEGKDAEDAMALSQEDAEEGPEDVPTVAPAAALVEYELERQRNVARNKAEMKRMLGGG